MTATRDMDVTADSLGRHSVGRFRKFLFQTSALGLGVSLAVLKAGSAEAQTCTTAPGAVNCPQGTYGPQSFNVTQNTTIDIAPGSTSGGLFVTNGNVGGVAVTADININAPGVDITRTFPAPGTAALFAYTLNGAPPGGPGSINIVAGNVVSNGANTAAIFAYGRNISVTAESAHTFAPTTTGFAPFGILAQSALNGSTISVDVGETSTIADSAHAIIAFAPNLAVNIDINSESATTSGTNALGVLAETGSGDINITSGSSSTAGRNAPAVFGRTTTGAVTVTSAIATTTGDGSSAVVGVGGKDVTITSVYAGTAGGTIGSATGGQRAIGIIGNATISPTSRNGNVLINSGLVEYTGAGGIGIYAASYDGDITINTGAIVADASAFFNDPALGGNGHTYSPVSLATDSYTGDVTINSGSIINFSDLGAGIAINRTTGLVTINTDLIDTYGDGAMGITTGGAYGNIVITSDVITTRGNATFVPDLDGAYLGRESFFADAIEAISLGGSVLVTSNDATVLGEGNQALTLIAVTGATLNSRNATNVGEGVNAIGIVSDHGLIDVNLTGDTAAENGTGVSLIALNDTDVDVDVGADASIVARDGGLVIVTGSGSTVITNRGHIETTGSDFATATGAAIDVKASTGAGVTINNHGTIIGGFAEAGFLGAAIDFSVADVDDTLNLFTGSHIVGSVDGQGGTDTLNLEGTIDAVTTSQGFGDIVGFEVLNANSGYWVQTGQVKVDTINVNDGALILTGTAAGDTTVDEGAILQIGAGGTTGSLDGDITANGTLIFNRSDDYLFGGALGGAGSLIKRGAGLVTIDGVYSFTGTTSILGGQLKITQLAAGGDLDLGSGGSLDLSGGDQSVGGLSGAAGSSINIDQGSLTIDQAEGETSTFGGSLVGDGALTVAGGGVLNLTGVNTYTGPTTVENGTLKVNGSISSAVTVNDGSILGGAGTINGSIVIRRNGTISPGNSPGVLSVVGPLTLSAGSTFEVEVDPTQPVINDRIDATGLVTIEAGALLHVTPQGAINLYQRVNEYTIINAAGGLTGTFAAGDISSSMALLKPRLVYSPTALRLQLIRNDIRFNAVANSSNQFAVATAAEATGDGQPVYNALIAQSDVGLRAGYDALSGEVHGGVGTFLIHEANGERDALLQRAARADSSGWWIEGLSQTATFDGNSARGSAEAEAETSGVSAGGQVAFNNMLFGGSVTYASTDFDVAQRSSDMTITSIRAGAFASAQAGVLIGRIGTEYAQSDMEGSRAIVFPGVSQTTVSDYSSSQLQVFGELAFDSRFAMFDFEPFLGFAGLDTEIDGFQESGPLGLTVEDSSRYVTVASAGFRLGGPDDWTLKPRLDVTYRHADGDTAGVVTSAFTGGSNFDVLGAGVDSDSTSVTAGLDYAIAPGIDMSVSYSGVFGTSTRQDAIAARFDMRF